MDREGYPAFKYSLMNNLAWNFPCWQGQGIGSGEREGGRKKGERPRLYGTQRSVLTRRAIIPSSPPSLLSAGKPCVRMNFSEALPT